MKGGWFSRTPAAAAFDRRLPDKTLRVLAVLGAYADKFGEAHPSVPKIAKHLGLSDRQVQRHLRKLEEYGYIVTERVIRHTRGGWGRNRYWLNYEKPAPLDQEDDGEVTSMTSPRDTTSKASPREVSSMASGREVTSTNGRGDIREGGEVTSWMSDNQPTEESSQWPNSPVVVRDACAREAGRFEEQGEGRPAQPSSVSGNAGAARQEGVAEPSRAERQEQVRQLFQAPPPSLDDANYLASFHNAVMDRLEACGMRRAKAALVLAHIPDTDRLELCRLAAEGKLGTAQLAAVLRRSQDALRKLDGDASGSGDLPPRTYLPEGWRPSEEMLEQVRREWPELNIDQMTYQFRALYLGRRDNLAKRRDWNAVWRDWISKTGEARRRVVEQQKKQGAL